MTSKRKSPCTAATVTEAAGNNLNDDFTPEFDECQAEHIWKRDMSFLTIAAIVIGAFYLYARIRGWIA